MKTLFTFLLLLTSIHFAHANAYPLLNDMKMVKKEQLLLKNIRLLISDTKNNNKIQLSKHKSMFTNIINGLTKGDSKLKLHGTELKFLKNKIRTIQLLWSQEKGIFDSALNNKMYKSAAYVTIDKLSIQLNALNQRYIQSYTRYKQNSTMKLLVNSYMKNTSELDPMYAINSLQ